MFKVIKAPLGSLNITSPFGMRDYGSYWWHNGIDYSCVEGTPVYAVADGIVKEARMNKGGGGYGLYVAIWHSRAGSLYGHLSKIVVDDEQIVKAGQLIGYSGNTGDSTGPHLHFEIRLCEKYAQFWERCVIDNKVFMRCVDPKLFVDDYLQRISLGVKDANEIVQRESGIDDNSLAYLNFYKYDDELLKKLARPMI